MVATTSLVAIAPPSVIPNADWHNVGLLHYRSSSSLRWDVDAFLQTRGYRPHLAAEVDDAVFLLEAAIRGGYVAFVPRSIARDAVAAKRARIVAALDSSYSGVYATYLHGESVDLARRAVEVLIEHARAALAD
jgi:DNA-binding transcriptional LysR family regulator